jgi:hypothetical protein
VDVPKGGRANFSHARVAEAKTIFEKSCSALIGRRWIGFSEDDVN